MTGMSAIAAIVAALDLPPRARVDTRVPKKMLVEQGAPTTADKRAIQDGVDEIHWLAALKPKYKTAGLSAAAIVGGVIVLGAVQSRL